MVTNTAFKPI